VSFSFYIIKREKKEGKKEKGGRFLLAKCPRFVNMYF
jgi:hypothetical protein